MYKFLLQAFYEKMYGVISDPSAALTNLLDQREAFRARVCCRALSGALGVDCGPNSTA
jgi:hypothetical protein